MPVALMLIAALRESVRVSVGADGVRLRRLLGGARFLPYASIREARIDGRDIEILLAGGERIHVHHPMGGGRRDLSDRELEGQKLVERIDERLAALRGHEDGAAPVFARAGRETDQWMRDVARAADVHASFRTPAVPPDALWRIVEDVAASATERAGAAVALRQALDDDGRVRLRAIADASAAPRLRVALETVASDDEEAHLQAALEELEDDDREVRQARR